jgi:hypothetical protein
MFIMPKHIFITYPMQLECATQLKKWLKMSLTTSGQPYDSWHSFQ